MSLSVRKLTSRIGAVVEDVDLTAEPSGEVIAALRGALNKYKVIVFDGVELNDPGQERVASWFGEVTAAHPTVPAVPGTTNVLAVDSETSKANEWHSDVTFVVNPPQVSTLRSIVTTPYGGETLIANAAAYRDLPEPLRDLATPVGGAHQQYDYARPRPDRGSASTMTSSFHVYEAEHPVVRVHPLTGSGLFVGRLRQADRRPVGR